MRLPELFSSLKAWAAIFLFFLTITLFPAIVQAATPQHFTTIISQVRGDECCSPGSVPALRAQVAQAEKSGLTLTLTVRYDALLNSEYQTVLRQAVLQGHEVGGFLEITPGLASASGVPYQGTPETWYQAENAYLIGYTPDQRLAILETYMAAFKTAFGAAPKTTTAWMIDTASLKTLREKYGVQVHQITREQWGTDSYTLDGGPPHLPYWPSESWLMIPAADQSTASATLPLIVRQTIADPVNNYGDRTNSFTSQPNDYALAQRGTEYFDHLFQQAHIDSTSPTFALLGLENSMPQEDQTEFLRQLERVGQWQAASDQNTVVTAASLATTWTNSPLMVSSGQDLSLQTKRQAWWITTPTYRARLRLDENELALTDLRLYSQDWVDPYSTQPAQKQGYWVVPFTLAAHRFWQGDPNLNPQRVWYDWLAPRDPKVATNFPPTRIVLARTPDENLQAVRDGNTLQIRVAGQEVARFSPENFWTIPPLQEQTQQGLLSQRVQKHVWKNRAGQEIWGWKTTTDQIGQRWTPFTASNTDFAIAREEEWPLLFPELSPKIIDWTQTEKLVTNAYAQAGRNPIRLAVFPKDSHGYPALLPEPPQVETSSSSVLSSVTAADGTEGLFFIDLVSAEPQQTAITIKVGDQTWNTTGTFAPDCTEVPTHCLRAPQQAWWFFRNWFGDQWRAWQKYREDQAAQKAMS